MDERADELAALRELVNHRGVVELLDLLAEGPDTVRELHATLGMRRLGVSRALQVLAARGLVRAEFTGSWDEPCDITGPIELTENGWRTVELLASFAVWESLHNHDSVRDL
ncbi:helix-turn-helix domain-containing protein [Nocardia sp. NPDC051030]|uniref:helix-turn-helix domain-containing protein n=1 Tax=Nocardia sp. NPDC051030 TaxID=3155162 RepID=UPI00343F5126